MSARIENREVCIAINDDGGGYPPAMLDAANPDMALKIGSTADATHLGLYFARAIAEHHCNGDKVGRMKLSNGGDLAGGLFELWLP